MKESDRPKSISIIITCTAITSAACIICGLLELYYGISILIAGFIEFVKIFIGLLMLSVGAAGVYAAIEVWHKKNGSRLYLSRFAVISIAFAILYPLVSFIFNEKYVQGPVLLTLGIGAAILASIHFRDEVRNYLK
jgi:uncharacterized membrane protein